MKGWYCWEWFGVRTIEFKVDTVNTDVEALVVENAYYFRGWIGDWQEAEVEE